MSRLAWTGRNREAAFGGISNNLVQIIRLGFQVRRPLHTKCLSDALVNRRDCHENGLVALEGVAAGLCFNAGDAWKEIAPRRDLALGGYDAVVEVSLQAVQDVLHGMDGVFPTLCTPLACYRTLAGVLCARCFLPTRWFYYRFSGWFPRCSICLRRVRSLHPGWPCCSAELLLRSRFSWSCFCLTFASSSLTTAEMKASTPPCLNSYTALAAFVRPLIAELISCIKAL